MIDLNSQLETQEFLINASGVFQEQRHYSLGCSKNQIIVPYHCKHGVPRTKPLLLFIANRVPRTKPLFLIIADRVFQEPENGSLSLQTKLITVM